MKSQRPKWSYLLHICLIGIIEHDLKLNRPIVEVMRILGSSLLTKDTIEELFFHDRIEKTGDGHGQLKFEFD